ncbi:LysE family translocator [Luteibacter yeojuensis]|uniref:LysE family translocator n=1 Tax=Luteibacter yeojuensis TaxID=345309 RepID=A0A7X5QVJ7_9GAMM|nr:LysE family translocator [Luteibacter yeojuensis]NID16107.1 LysE family translocator [Luteibacter yeojuensis]
MNMHLLTLFVATVLPLVCAPGPDMLFIASQAVSGNASGGLRATAGVCAGYVVHSVLVAIGLAALIAASPLLFGMLRWAGVAYLAYLAVRLLRSALKPRGAALAPPRGNRQFGKGFLTAVLNPKGMMIYFAILPQFMTPGGSSAMQALVLSAIFIALCGLVYSVLSILLARGGSGPAGFGDRRRRYVEGISGGIILVAAAKLATT